ncbi:hypothetical protein VSR01_09670 [Actinacidiphila sp. DG2A-62]|uniref:hypothetical protein n=1 Tax=Actinacidiphila sp. DG2A-62 TaxID=3108821 RepID=UPI002DB87D08|nr:hypothetical protein [Actinacidiphila sp. DG2A-62]MEC3993794.1 hypothetical protein [Actinacidiphila sp. DG2A-62]
MSVDTSALKIFADNLDTIASVVKTARQKLDPDHLNPILAGDDRFVEAHNLTSAITGKSGGEGLQQNYLDSLHALCTALEGTAEGIRDIATKYSTIEEVNAKAGNELSDLIREAQGDIQAIRSATEGTDTGTSGSGDTSGTSGSPYGYPYGGSGDTSGTSGSPYPSDVSGSPYDPSYGGSAATPSVWGAPSGAAPSAVTPRVPDGSYGGSSPTWSNPDGLTGEPAPVAEGPGPVVHPGEAVRVRLDPSAPSDSDVRDKGDDVRVRADGSSDPDVRVKADGSSDSDVRVRGDDVRVRADGSSDPDVRVKADGSSDPDVRVKTDGTSGTTSDEDWVRERTTGLPGF